MKIPYRTKTKLVDLANLKPTDICIEDIACALAGQARFNGITRPVYSVAQHSVLCSLMAPEGYELSALMHDAHEYILGDISRPVATLIKCALVGNPEVEYIKEDVDYIIRERFGIDIPFWIDQIVEIDNRMLATEMVRFFGTNYLDGFEPYYDDMNGPIWDTEQAERMFLDRFYELTK